LGRKAKKKREKQPFWKKIKNPELKHIAEHIGKVIDNTSAKEILDLVLTGATAYLGYSASKALGANLKDSLKGALTGAVAYRLALAPNMIAGASGTIALAGLGLISVYNPIQQWLQVNLGWSGSKELEEKLGNIPEVVNPWQWLNPEHWSGGIHWNPERGVVVIAP